ncbi:MAG: pilin [Parcubacteria group bacterium]|jgi:cytochrome bd-type quinol oxidase subunit 2
MKKYLFRLTSFSIALFFVVCSASAEVTLPTGTGLSNKDLTTVISNLTNWILGIFGFLAIISFVVSGIMYFLSAGDDKAQEKAKKQMTWSIMGVVIGLIGLVVITAVDLLLGGS